jgi:integrase
MPTAKLTKSLIDSLSPAPEEVIYWDTETKGFGVRVHPSGRKVFVVQKAGRLARRKRKITIGETNLQSLKEAREEATKRILEIRSGSTRKAEVSSTLNVDDLSERFLASIKYKLKARTQRDYAASIRNYISPLLGNKVVTQLSRSDVNQMIQRVRQRQDRASSNSKLKGGLYPALHARSTLSAMLSFAVAEDIVSQNVCLQIRLKQPDGRKRVLTETELRRLGAAVARRRLCGTNETALSIIELLLLTGARKNEICALEWSFLDLDLGIARLPDSKTGPKIIGLCAAAVAILKRQPRETDSKWVFPATSGSSHFQGAQKIWSRVRQDANIKDVRIHDLRHTFATWGVDDRVPLYNMKQALGHRHTSTTEQYVHSSNTGLKTAADTVGEKIWSNYSADADHSKLQSKLEASPLS